jgi:hypothetical protein
MTEYIKCIDGITREFDKWRHGGWWCRNCSRLVKVNPEDHTCTLTYKTLATGGKDRYGHYFNFTGHEGKGCFWCGKQLNKTNKRYCNKECSHEYFRHFFWSSARDWCLERYDDTCQGCGAKGDLEVHHIDPVGVDGYGWHIKNRPENLIPLCVKCHGETRRKVIVESKQEQLALF